MLYEFCFVAVGYSILQLALELYTPTGVKETNCQCVLLHFFRNNFIAIPCHAQFQNSSLWNETNYSKSFCGLGSLQPREWRWWKQINEALLAICVFSAKTTMSKNKSTCKREMFSESVSSGYLCFVDILKDEIGKKPLWDRSHKIWTIHPQ